MSYFGENIAYEPTYSSRVHLDDVRTPSNNMMQNNNSNPKNAIVAICLQINQNCVK